MGAASYSQQACRCFYPKPYLNLTRHAALCSLPSVVLVSTNCCALVQSICCCRPTPFSVLLPATPRPTHCCCSPTPTALSAAPQVFQFVVGQGGHPGYVGEPVTNKTEVGGFSCVFFFCVLVGCVIP